MRSRRDDRAARLRAARDAATELVRRLGLDAPAHIDVDDVAELLGAEVVVGPLPRALAQVVRVGDVARIRISDHIVSEGRRRFSIAHELGHLWLGHAPRAFAELCSAIAIEGAPVRVEEAEANAFATELLMPARMIAPWVASAPPDIAIARQVADAFRVSLTAAALRMVELSPESCAVVVCHRGRIRWASRSATFPAFLPRGRVPGVDAGVVEHLAWGSVPRGPRRIPVSAWLGEGADGGAMLVEDAAALPGDDVVLTILVVEHAIEPTPFGK